MKFEANKTLGKEYPYCDYQVVRFKEGKNHVVAIHDRLVNKFYAKVSYCLIVDAMRDFTTRTRSKGVKAIKYKIDLSRKWSN